MRSGLLQWFLEPQGCRGGNDGSWRHSMGRIGLTELLVILGIVIFLFGAKRIPEMGKGIGEGIRNFKKSMKNDDTEETGSEERKSKVA